MSRQQKICRLPQNYAFHESHHIGYAHEAVYTKMQSRFQQGLYHSADFVEHFLIRHGSAVAGFISLPQKAGGGPSALSHMPVKAVVCYVGPAPLEPGVLNLALPHVKIAGVVVLVKLQSPQA